MLYEWARWEGMEIPSMHIACQSGHPSLENLTINNKLGIYGLVLSHLPALQYVEYRTITTTSLPQLRFVLVESSLITREIPLDMHLPDSVMVIRHSR